MNNGTGKNIYLEETEMIKYENGEIVISKDSALEELRQFAIDFGEMVYEQTDKTLDVELGIDCLQVAVYFTFIDVEGLTGDICYFQEDIDDDAKEYRLQLADEEEMAENFEGDPKSAIAFVKENLEKFFAK